MSKGCLISKRSNDFHVQRVSFSPQDNIGDLNWIFKWKSGRNCVSCFTRWPSYYFVCRDPFIPCITHYTYRQFIHYRTSVLQFLCFAVSVIWLENDGSQCYSREIFLTCMHIYIEIPWSFYTPFHVREIDDRRIKRLCTLYAFAIAASYPLYFTQQS